MDSGQWRQSKITCIREFITQFLLVRLMGNPMSFLWARPLFTVFIHIIIAVRCVPLHVCVRDARVCPMSVRIGHLIEALNFSVIVHISIAHTHSLIHTRALFGMTSIFNCVFGAYSRQKYAWSTHILVPVTYKMRMTHDDTKLNQKRRQRRQQQKTPQTHTHDQFGFGALTPKPSITLWCLAPIVIISFLLFTFNEWRILLPRDIPCDIYLSASKLIIGHSDSGMICDLWQVIHRPSWLESERGGQGHCWACNWPDQIELDTNLFWKYLCRHGRRFHSPVSGLPPCGNRTLINCSWWRWPFKIFNHARSSLSFVNSIWVRLDSRMPIVSIMKEWGMVGRKPTAYCNHFKRTDQLVCSIEMIKEPNQQLN